VKSKSCKASKPAIVIHHDKHESELQLQKPKNKRASHLWLNYPYNLNDGFIRAYVQVSAFVQGNPAYGLCLDLG